MRKAKENKASRAEEAQQLNEAWNANHQAIEFQNNGDLAKAVALFEEAARKSPDDPIIRDNLSSAKATLQTQQAYAERQRRDQTGAANMQQAINTFAQILNAAPASSGGLDFDGRNSGNPPGGGTPPKPPVN